MGLVMNTPEFKAIHTINVKVKKIKKMKSILKLVGKLAQVFVGMAKRIESYNRCIPLIRDAFTYLTNLCRS
jgi:transposase